MEKEYKGVIVAKEDNNLRFAIRTDSPEETGHIMWDEVLRLLDEFSDGKIEVERAYDGYGEPIIRIKYEDGVEALAYKLFLANKNKSKTETNEEGTS